MTRTSLRWGGDGGDGGGGGGVDTCWAGVVPEPWLADARLAVLFVRVGVSFSVHLAWALATTLWGCPLLGPHVNLIKVWDRHLLLITLSFNKRKHKENVIVLLFLSLLSVMGEGGEGCVGGVEQVCPASRPIESTLWAGAYMSLPVFMYDETSLISTK